MIIKKVEFVKSSTAEKDCPSSLIPEFAFIGRSNVGKSSLINFLTGRKNLAKTSGTPGKTRLINHFIVNEDWHLVDLPGYGYAKVNRKERKNLINIIEDYIINRKQMVCLFVLVDIRHEPHTADIDFINLLGVNNIPFIIVFTKSDKLTQREISLNIKLFSEKLYKAWEQLPQIFVSTIKNKEGRDELLDYIGETISSLKK